ncbi:hypothetical protein INT46_010643 [Mucor plumbeus]|uniref:Saccharopine dehydrogenase NADP binding domain-containing protein n=1 Tax=Mucor plumbeus TaxID=97098 RepID=A0A8H7RI51_9FUNG|nr:hypothetical protein INT46_010643 [Mucor plumbeus]
MDLLIADSNQPESLNQILSQTRVVVSTVGPYKKYGTPLVEACIRQKTHYIDICGEHTWIKSIIDNFHTQAIENNVMIVNSCGFDSVPSDLGVYMLSNYAKKVHNSELANVKMSVIKMVGSFSSGTIHSLYGSFSDPSLTSEQKSDPYLLATRKGIDKSVLHTLKRDVDFSNLWQSYFIMSSIDEKIVRRSWSIWTDRGQGYGSQFTYKETMSFDFLTALITTSLLYSIALLIKVPFLCEKIKTLFPAYGEGPDAESRAKGMSHVEFVGTLHGTNISDSEDHQPKRIRGIVKGFRDPGYGDTCRMVIESALCIIKSFNELPGKEGGVLTPSTAFGNTLLERLQHDGQMLFEVKDI